MNNPDEETTIAQFGDGDKAFGVATLMATLPGLPMFGHGQVEGLREKYGMEYRRAKLDERPAPGMVDRHRAQIAPLLERRRAFAGTDRFRLFEVHGAHGPLHDVFAYANGEQGGPANLVLYHNRYGEAYGTIRHTAPFPDRSGGGTRRERLEDVLRLRGGVDRFVRYRDLTSGDEHLARSDAWRDDGLSVHLGAYQCRVLLDIREIRDTDGRWERLLNHLNGSGVPDLDDALHDLELAPLHRAFASLASDAPVAPQADAASGTEPAASTKASAPESTREPLPPDAGQPLPATVQPPSDRDLEPFVRAVRDVVDDLRPDADRLRAMWTRIPPNAEAPGPAWRRAWAVAASFARPADAARRLRLDRAVATRLVQDEPLGIGAEAWATLWLESLPARHASVAAERAAAANEPSTTGSIEESRTASAAEPATSSATRPATRSAKGRGSADDAASDARSPTSAATGDGAHARSTDGSEAVVGRGVDEPEHEPQHEPDPEAVRIVESALSGLDREGPVRTILGVHAHEGVRWFRREGFRAWRGAWLATQRLEGASANRLAQLADLLDRAEAESDYRFERLVAWVPARRSD